MKRPAAFEMLHQRDLLGKVTLPDRVLFRGHLKLRDARTLGMFLLYRFFLRSFFAFCEDFFGDQAASAYRLG
jgi:hypothetical protein